jgi:hypothetical protein
MARVFAWYLRHRLAPAFVLLAVAISAWSGFWRYHLKRFHVVDVGTLYRAGQPTELGFRHLKSWHNVRTVVSFRLEDPRLPAGLLDLGEPDGDLESEYIERLGLKHVQWPMGAEPYWPWVTPWQFEKFLEFFDDPANLPAVVHCVGGRHRTGTFAALYQLEYQRLPVDAVIAEMLTFKFGPLPWIQDHNLRTYLPRPRPTPLQWQALATALFGPDRGAWPADYEELVLRMRQGSDRDELVDRLRMALEQDQPFAICLAARLIEAVDDPLAGTAVECAARQLEATERDAATWAVSAALVADFGAPEQQQELLSILQDETHDAEPSPRYQAVVSGVTNRYTPNRIAYLFPLLSDMRTRPEPNADGYRYCDTAVARLASITGEERLVQPIRHCDLTDEGVIGARQWFAEHRGQTRLVRLLPPTGENSLVAVPGGEIDGRNIVR